uniref:Ankyrin repeat domain 6 n=1 Tax=Hucho hucho TaxID=62062 RepID=A0A4W5JDV1_9TELE
MSDREAAQAHVLLSSQGHQTALHRAAMVGNCDIIDGLIKGGCALDLQDKDGNTALHEVSWHGFCQSVKLLVKAGADVHVRNKAGNTALHLACQNANGQSAHVLLLGGSRPDIKNNVGDTCLHVAARYNHLAMIKILVGALCSVTEKNQVGDTALHVAAALNHKKTVQLLLEAGTDGNARNNAGKTALDKARDYNHKDVSLLLARAPQVRRTVRKKRDRLKAERRTQSTVYIDRQKMDDSRRRYANPMLNVMFTLFVPLELLGWDKAEVEPSWTFVYNWTIKLSSPSPLPPAPPPHNGKTYQLYTLYRDKDGNVKQAPANGCHCKPLIKRLEGELNATKEEMRTQMLTVQEQVFTRLGRIDRKSIHQIKVRDMLTQERVAAERMECLYRMDQRAAQGREEAQRRQVLYYMKLKRWCMTQIQDMDLHLPADPQYYKLLPSPSVDSSSLATYVTDDKIAVVNTISMASHCPLVGCGPMIPFHLASEKGLCGEGVTSSSSSLTSCIFLQVTQRFFETVSTQLECWYERKIHDAKRQAELRAQQDRAELLQRIRSLEEELEQLRMTNGMSQDL